MTDRSGRTHIHVLVVGPHVNAQATFVKALASALSSRPPHRAPSSSLAAPAAVGGSPTNGTTTAALHQKTPHAANPFAAGDSHNTSNNTNSKSKSSISLLLGASDPFTAFQLAPEAWVTWVTTPGDAPHQVLYSLQAAPGWAATPDAAAYLETLTRLVLEGRRREFERLHDSCGSEGCQPIKAVTPLGHAHQVCLYLLPPSGPTATDLVLLAALSHTLPLVPLVTPLASPGCHPVTPAAGEALLEEVAQLLEDPGQLVMGLKAGDIVLPLGGPLLVRSSASHLGPDPSCRPDAEGGSAGGAEASSPLPPLAASAAAPAASSIRSMSCSSRATRSAGSSICSDAMEIWDLDLDLDLEGEDVGAAASNAGGVASSSSHVRGGGSSSNSCRSCARVDDEGVMSLPTVSSIASSHSHSSSSLLQLPVSAAAGTALGSSSEEAFEWVALTAGADSEELSDHSHPEHHNSSSSCSTELQHSSLGGESPQQPHNIGTPSDTAAAAAAAVVMHAGDSLGQREVGGDSSGQQEVCGEAHTLELQQVVELLTGRLATQLLRQLSVEAFETFCTKYHAAGGNLEQLLAATLRPFVPGLLAGPSLLQECVAQAKQQLKECEVLLQQCEKQREGDAQDASRKLQGQLRDGEQRHQQQLQQLLQAAATEHQAAVTALRQQLVGEQQAAASKLAAVQEEADRQLVAVQQEADRQLAAQQAEAEQQLSQQEDRYMVLQQQMRVQQQRATTMLQQALNTAAAEQQWALNNVQVSVTQQQAETEQRLEDLQRQVQDLRRQLREERQAAARAAVQFDRSNALHKQQYQRLWEQLLQERQQAGQQLQEAQQAAAEQHWRREMVQQQLQQERQQAEEQVAAAREHHERLLQQQVAAERQRAAADEAEAASLHQQEVAALKDQLLKVQAAATAAAARHKETATQWMQVKGELDQQLTKEKGKATLLQQQLQEQQTACQAAGKEAAAACQQVEQLRSAAKQQFAAFKRLQLTAAADKEGYEAALQQLRLQLAEAQDKLARGTKQLEGQIALHRWYRQAVSSS